MTSDRQAPAPDQIAVEREPAVVLADSDTAAYNALQSGAVFFTMPARHISRFTGAKAADALNGLVTNDVLPLEAGRGLYAAALTPKGKMLADVSILRIDAETFLVETGASAAAEWWSMVRKYVNPRLAQYKDESALHTAIWIYGPAAPSILARLSAGAVGDAEMTGAMAEGLAGWPDWAHASFALSGLTVRVVRAPYLGTKPGFVLLATADSGRDLARDLERVGAIAGSGVLWQMAQLESAWPAMGLDMDASTIPQEANLESWNAISFEKGCYTGQETVARIHFRGHVNKLLRGLKSARVLAPGSVVHDVHGKMVGDVRRAGDSPRFGCIAIAMLRRELLEGDNVTVFGGSAAVAARIARMPFAFEEAPM